jgi:hypothetical protein
VRREPSQALFILNPEVKQFATWTMCALNPKEGSDMRTCRIFLSLAIAIGGGIAVQNPAFSQEYRGTLEQQMACTPDVFRLCGEQIPDTNRIVACLRQNTPQLSSPCRAVFESNASVPQQQAVPRRRDDQPKLYNEQ